MAARKSLTVKLSDAAVRKLTCPQGRSYIVYTHVGGNLTIRVSPTGKVWRYRFRFGGGNPETITLGKWPHLAFDGAMERVRDFENARAKGVHPRELLRQNRSVTTVRDVLDHHLSTLKDPNKKGVRSLYRDILRDHGATPISAFTRKVAKDWISRNYKHRKGSARVLIRNLTAAFHRAKDSVSDLNVPTGYEHPTSGISKHIKWLKESKPGSLAVAYEDDQWRKILDAIHQGYSDPDTCYTGPLCLELILHTGARPSEIQSLRWDELDDHRVEGKLLKIAVKDRHKTWATTDRPRQIFFSQEAVSVLERAAEYRNRIGYTGPYIFPSRRMQKNQKVEYVSRLTALAHRLGKAAGLDFMPYNFRSAYINYAIQTLGFDKLAVVSENVGHTDPKTTMKYYMRQRVSDRAEAAQKVGESFGKLRGPAAISAISATWPLSTGYHALQTSLSVTSKPLLGGFMADGLEIHMCSANNFSQDVMAGKANLTQAVLPEVAAVHQAMDTGLT